MIILGNPEGNKDKDVRAWKIINKFVIAIEMFFMFLQSIYVTKVQPDGPAAYGLVPGDRILEVR